MALSLYTLGLNGSGMILRTSSGSAVKLTKMRRSIYPCIVGSFMSLQSFTIAGNGEGFGEEAATELLQLHLCTSVD